MPNEHIYQRMLIDDFERRKSRNTSYSLRAFARDLGVPAPKLSEYLSGKCGLSRKKANELAERIRLGAHDAEIFICSAEAAHARDKVGRESARRRLNVLLSGPSETIDSTVFQKIRDWYHVAILELLETDTFQSDTRWIATQLGISNEQVERALNNLESLKLIKLRRGRWIQTGRDFQTTFDVSSAAIREYHRQILLLTVERFHSVDLADREMSSAVFAMDRTLLPELKKLLRRQHKEVATLLASGSKKDSVYTLNHQLLPLTGRNEK